MLGYEKKRQATLVLENGANFDGWAFGHLKNTAGEVVFTTGMTGYQETFTDPSFAGQIVTMTYPLIGNYGLNLEDMEADAPRMRGCIVREKCEAPSNWRCEMSLDGFFKQYRVTGLEGVDTRRLTKMLRESGTLRGSILIEGCQDDLDFTDQDKNLVRDVTCGQVYDIPHPFARVHLAVMDFGLKKNILRELHNNDCALTVFPAFSSAEKILSCNPDAVFLTNGPGDPQDLPSVVKAVQILMDEKPVLGICLGHQIIALASGCDTQRLK
ncbi:MAG: carbamoyl phosphate synthase small subunit, partial [Clostridiales bacterium]|nr:carbamoyl phosphate synthase small subunit [Clostridiales bacterium]